MMRWPVLAIIISIVFLLSCEPFLSDEMKGVLREWENKTFVVKEDVKVNLDTVRKGQKIKLKILMGSNWVKIRGYSADVDPLKVKQVLLLYMFEDDFPKKKFSLDYLTQKFDAIAIQQKQK